MLANPVKNKIMTDECLTYCTRGIIQLLNGNKEEFNMYVDKAIEINKQDESKNNIVNCKYKLDGKKIKSRMNMITGEIVDLEGNILKEGVKHND